MTISFDPLEWEQSVYLPFNPADGWEKYHEALDDLTHYAAEVTEPFILVFHPAGDVPKGNPMTHMRRIVTMSKTNPKILKTIIVMDNTWIFAKAFVRILSSIMDLEPEVKLVFGMEEARRVHAEALALQLHA